MMAKFHYITAGGQHRIVFASDQLEALRVILKGGYAQKMFTDAAWMRRAKK